MRQELAEGCGIYCSPSDMAQCFALYPVPHEGSPIHRAAELLLSVVSDHVREKPTIPGLSTYSSRPNGVPVLLTEVPKQQEATRA
jgi:hypothetical protein